ncbi:hypothetical protein Aoki45_00900 [Algoriphagus sp. oki45]|nr:hypothetical protein Aoki45_00900 [Algoriphagus sp. oki45]
MQDFPLSGSKYIKTEQFKYSFFVQSFQGFFISKNLHFMTLPFQKTTSQETIHHWIDY